MRIQESNIKTLMAKQGIKTQIELARLCNLNHVNLNRLIKGRRESLSGVTINKLCEVLDAQPGDFLYFKKD